MSTLSFSRVTLGALALAASLLGSACEVGRPEGFIPKKREAKPGNPDLFADSGTEPMGSNNGDIDDPDFPVPDEEDGGTPVSSDSPLAKAAGYYWLRTDIEFTYSRPAGFQTLRVFNRVSHLALTRLWPSGETLKAVERTCHIFYQHECKAACSTFTTTIAPDAVKLYRQDLPRVYTLTSNSMFVTDANSLLLGWTGPADKLPTSVSDPSVWNASPNIADSKGFYLNVRANGLPQVVDCYYNTVERFTSSYSGSLKSGSLDGINAKLSTEGSHAGYLDYQGGGSCTPPDPDAADSPAPSLSSVRFVRVEESDTFWDCPTIADFKAKLADP